jgi:hypothetical protein
MNPTLNPGKVHTKLADGIDSHKNEIVAKRMLIVKLQAGWYTNSVVEKKKILIYGTNTHH